MSQLAASVVRQEPLPVWRPPEQHIPIGARLVGQLLLTHHHKQTSKYYRIDRYEDEGMHYVFCVGGKLDDRGRAVNEQINKFFTTREKAR